MSRPLPIDTRVSDVGTRFQQVTFRLQGMAEGKDYERESSAAYAKELLWQVLPYIGQVVDLLGEYDGQRHSSDERLRAEASGVLDKLRARKKDADRHSRIAKLEQVDGRTPEEAAAFLEKARQLREEAS